jgi:general secretion pathway protein A
MKIVYADYYRLKEKPFELAPSTRFLYLGEAHREALDLLIYGVMERRGFILLTGEVGSGKSTMVQALLSNLNDDVSYLYLANPLSSPLEFMNYLAAKVFKQETPIRSKAEFLIAYEFDLLDELRLLSNMGASEGNLVNIFLVGQPEFVTTLNDPRCRPLLQRIGNRYHIPPLDLEGTKTYMATRLKAAGVTNPNDLFSKRAIRAIHRYSGGYPRTINILADNCLLLGYSTAKKNVNRDMVKASYEELRPHGIRAEAEDVKPVLPEAHKVAKTRTTNHGLRWATAAFLLVIGFVIALGAGWKGSEILSHISEYKQLLQQVSATASPTAVTTLRQPITRPESITPKEGQPISGPVLSSAQGEEDVISQQPAPAVKDDLDVVLHTAKEPTDSERAVIVQQGNSLGQLAANFYGKVDRGVLEHLKKHNPEIENINVIQVGQRIFFPPMPVHE